jgi:hypothetical protein
LTLEELYERYRAAQEPSLEKNTQKTIGTHLGHLMATLGKGFLVRDLTVYGSPHRSFRRGEGFSFDRTTCVVLTPGGAAFVDRFLRAPMGSPRSVPPIETTSLADGETAALEGGLPGDDRREVTIRVISRPCWDSMRRELRLCGVVVKRYRVPAHNQELILSAFEEEGWPEHIDDPLPARHDIDPHTRLHDAIHRLNGCQTHRLLRFRGDGSGAGVFWELHRAEAGGSLNVGSRALEGNRPRASLDGASR